MAYKIKFKGVMFMKKLLLLMLIGVFASCIISTSFADAEKEKKSMEFSEIKISKIKDGGNIRIVDGEIEEVKNMIDKIIISEGLKTGASKDRVLISTGVICVDSNSNSSIGTMDLKNSVDVKLIESYEEFIKTFDEIVKPISKEDNLKMKELYEKATKKTNGKLAVEYFDEIHNLLGKYFK